VSDFQLKKHSILLKIVIGMKKILLLLLLATIGVLPINAQQKKPVQTPKTTAAPLKKDGTPDKRYKQNKHLKKDGTPDKRFKQHKTTGSKTTKGLP
jgi:hypothetical protein